MTELTKPSHLFDRDAEWDEVASYATNKTLGATLALVYGRRRQGKTLLLDSLADATGGFYFTGLEQSPRQNLIALGETYARYLELGSPVQFPSWERALDDLLALGEHSEPVLIVLDEFPYLARDTPALPSLLQKALKPRGRARSKSMARLILCGSMFSVMRQLVSGTAPLRGRLVREIVLQPFNYRESATFWGIEHDWDLAFRLHALCGGTPAYLDYCFGDVPTKSKDFDRWVVRNLLNPASAFFREGRILLAEEPKITDLALYYSVLTAISWGKTRRGEIASVLGREQTAIAHPLAVLEEAQLITRNQDPLRERRSSYRIAEPLLRFSQLVIQPNEADLVRRAGAPVWNDLQPHVASKIFGPHFERLAREWTAQHATGDILADRPQHVGTSEISCKEHRSKYELDVVATRDGQVLALGEAKWTNKKLDINHLHRLKHIRDLLVNAKDARLLLFSRSGFTADLHATADQADDVHLVDLERLYTGG